jgi:hypothetical protein
MIAIKMEACFRFENQNYMIKEGNFGLNVFNLGFIKTPLHKEKNFDTNNVYLGVYKDRIIFINKGKTRLTVYDLKTFLFSPEPFKPLQVLQSQIIDARFTFGYGTAHSSVKCLDLFSYRGIILTQGVQYEIYMYDKGTYIEPKIYSWKNHSLERQAEHVVEVDDYDNEEKMLIFTDYISRKKTLVKIPKDCKLPFTNAMIVGQTIFLNYRKCNFDSQGFFVFDLDLWKKFRLLWISKLKHQSNDCYFSFLPFDMIKEISKLILYDPLPWNNFDEIKD